MNRKRFESKVALVTGGNSGMGLAVAKRLVEEGAKVVISGRDQASLDRAVDELGAAACGVRADVSRLDQIDRLVAEAGRFGGGRIDVLFANAGTAFFGPVAKMTEAQWDDVMNVNLKGVYFTVQKVLPLMQSGGSIVLNASVAAGKGNPMGSIYGASKAGVRSLARSLGHELVGRGIRVNVVSPGPIETPLFTRTGGMPKEAIPAMKEQWAERNPMKRFGSADEVAGAVLYLASSDASYVTGVDLLVDGGLGSF